MSPFDFVKAINTTKKDLIAEDAQLERLYVPWIINKSLSYFSDTIFQANEMNESAHIDHKLQFDYYLNDVKKRQRFSKWIKKEEDDNIDVVVEYYGVSRRKAAEILSLLSQQQKEQIKQKLLTGGVHNERNTKSTNRG